MRYIFVFGLIFLFFGCNSKQKVGYFDEDKISQQAVVNTRKEEISQGENRTLLAVTYINPIEKSNIKQNDEQFVINIFTNDEKKLDSLITGASLNGKTKGISCKKLDINSSLAKLSPTYSKWGRYFLLKAPLQKKKILKLTIQIDKKQRVSLDFLKDFLK